MQSNIHYQLTVAFCSPFWKLPLSLHCATPDKRGTVCLSHTGHIARGAASDLAHRHSLRGHHAHTHHILGSSLALKFPFPPMGLKKKKKKKKLKKPQEQPSQRSLARSLLQRKYVIAVNPKVIECSCGVNVTKKTVEPPGSNETVLEFIHQFVKCQSSSHC